MRDRESRISVLVLMLGCLATVAAAEIDIDSTTFGGLYARSIGPAIMSGRIVAIDAVAEDPLTIYAGAASGGVWRSKDGGITWSPIFEDHPQSIGAIAVDPGDAETVWAGTGESWARNSVSVGAGVFKSTDGGDSWSHVGLEDYADEVEALRTSLVSTAESGWLSGDEKLREKLGNLFGDVVGFEGRPTRLQLDRTGVLAARLEAAQDAFARVTNRTDLAQINRQLQAKGLEPVEVMSREAWDAAQEQGAAAGGSSVKRLVQELEHRPWLPLGGF